MATQEITATLTDPEPVPGCAHCDKVAQDRDRAKANGDASGVSDCNVRMRRHLGDAHK
ncbi:hypothetical protein [Streptomyces sp. NPDC094144]|uniref:hypothetical protein n=1 Tax=Streptomyces sp. NPDC094144 TaxID=3366056 RepID=UPI003818689B